MTIVLATHDVDQAWSLCDERVVLADGRVVDDGGWRIGAGGDDVLTANRLRVPLLVELWRRLGRGGDGGAARTAAAGGRGARCHEDGDRPVLPGRVGAAPLDPRAKIVAVTALSIALFTRDPASPPSASTRPLAAGRPGRSAACRCRWFWRGLRPLLWLVALTFVAQALVRARARAVAAGPLHISEPRARAGRLPEPASGRARAARLAAHAHHLADLRSPTVWPGWYARCGGCACPATSWRSW